MVGSDQVKDVAGTWGDHSDTRGPGISKCLVQTARDR